MYKQELQNIPLVPIPKKPNKIEDNSTIAYFAEADIVDLKKSGRVLVVDYYDINTRNLKVRFFVNKKEKQYITYNCLESKFEGKSLWKILENSNQVNSYIGAISSNKSLKMAMSYLGTYRERYYCFTTFCEVNGITGVCENFCQEIRDNRAIKASRSNDKRQTLLHSQFLDLDNDSKKFHSRQKKWDKWVESRFDRHYVFFSNLDKKRKRKCYCSHCKKHFISSDENIKHKHIGICPKCKAEIVYCAERFATTKEDKLLHDAVFIDGNENYHTYEFAVVKRTFSDDFKPQFKYEPYYRSIKELKTNKLLSSSYNSSYWYGKHWSNFKMWKPYRKVNVCPLNVDKLIGLPNYFSEIIEREKHTIDVFTLLDNLLSAPVCEYLCKMGLTSLVSSFSRGTEINVEGKNFQEVMGVTKQYLPMYRDMNVTYYEHLILQCANDFVNPKLFEQFRNLGINLSRYYEEIKYLLDFMSLQKFCNYIAKQLEVRKKSIGVMGMPVNNDYSVIFDLKDYIQISLSMDISLNKKNMFPADIHKAHDELVARYNQVKKEIEREESRKALALVNDFFTEYKNKELTVLVPHEKADFVREGQELSNCVGNDNYYLNHIKGCSMIFFIHKVSEPEKSYFATEIDMFNGTVKQLYGYGNCTAPKNVKDFVNGFARWLMKNKKRMKKAG